MQLAMIGLGRMGGNMVERLVQGGHELIVYDSSAAAVKTHAGKGVKAAKDLADVAKQLAPRRVVWVMVPAGAPVESTIEQLVPHLTRGDIVIDGGNSNFRDSLRRAEALKTQGIDDALIQPYSGHASRLSLEIYSRLALSEAQKQYDAVIDRFPV